MTSTSTQYQPDFKTHLYIALNQVDVVNGLTQCVSSHIDDCNLLNNNHSIIHACSLSIPLLDNVLENSVNIKPPANLNLPLVKSCALNSYTADMLPVLKINLITFIFIFLKKETF